MRKVKNKDNQSIKHNFFLIKEVQNFPIVCD